MKLDHETTRGGRGVTPWWLLALLLSACGGDSATGGSDHDTASDAGDGRGPSTGTSGGSGDGGTGQATPGSDDAVPPLPDGVEVGGTGLRRLTAHEYDNVIRDLLGDDTRPARSRLPEDVRSPFDNGWQAQVPSRVLVAGLESLATDVTAAWLADEPRRSATIGCTPAGTGEACMREFTERFARLAWRRPVTEAEVEEIVELGMSFAPTPSDFHSGVEVIVRALLQSAELLYRIEFGSTPEGEPFALTAHEIATRMSFLIWGSSPDPQLLDHADGGMLESAEGRRDAALRLLSDPRARDQVDRFHAMWLGFESLPHSVELTRAMRTESRTLVERVVFEERRAWTELFQSTETWLDDTLASHYGLPAPSSASGGWVDVGDSGRQGILSHGAFLSAAANPLDTSPTKRGKLVLDRLLCAPVPPPPPDVEADEPPSADLGMCKVDQYAAHRTEPRCAGCHSAMDGIGFGLERYDRAGRYREVEEGRPQCAIDGRGELPDHGPFSGPAELSDLLVAADLLDECVVSQLFTYAMGRPPEAGEDALLQLHARHYIDAGRLFDELVLQTVQHEAFAIGRAPTEATP